MELTGPALLDAIKYLPCIRSRSAEIRGYEKAAPVTKAVLHPLVSLSRLGRVGQASKVLEIVADRIGACFLDLNVVPSQSCDDWAAVSDPDNAYSAWRSLVASAQGITPVALLLEGAPERSFVRQVLAIERTHGSVVVRSRRPAAELPALQAALSAIDDVNNLLIALDFGYVRGALEPKSNEARRVITALRTTDSTARIAVIGSSFPRSISVYGDKRGTIDIIERDLHAQIGGDEVAIYGDHASIYPEPFEPSISRWVPRVDYCTDLTWSYERRRDGDGGYVECAKRTVASDDWDADFATSAWGASVIAETALSGRIPQGFGSPGNWIAARVNMHIERQASAASLGPNYEDDDFEF